MIRPRLLLWLALLVALMVPASARAQEPAVRYERYDVTIEVAADGTIVVRERQQVRFDGEFRRAFAEIPLAYTESPDALSVGEPERPYREAPFESPGRYQVARDGDNLLVEWFFEPTEPGEVRTFELAYRVAGGLWLYPDQTVLERRAVGLRVGSRIGAWSFGL